MNSQERVLTVIQREIPDRIPTFEWDIDPGLISMMTNGGTYEDFIEKYDLDAVMCGPTYRKEPVGDGLILDEWGVTRLVGHEAYAMPVDAKAPIKNIADLETWNPPDPYAPHLIYSMKERITRFKGKRAIITPLRDVWSNPRDLLGYERLLLNSALEPDFVSALVEKCIDHSIAMVGITAELGGEIIMSGDDIADNNRTLISPKMWEQIFMPHFRRWVQAIHDHGMFYWKHTDGNIKAVINDLIDAGIDGIDPIDPIAGLDLASAKQEWGKKVAIKGNVDCASVLVDGTEAEVHAAVRTCILAAGERGGYACSSSNSIHSGVDPKLYITMLNAIRRIWYLSSEYGSVNAGIRYQNQI